MATKSKPKRRKIVRKQRNKPNFWDNVKKTTTHWLWHGVVGKQTGYGFFTRDGENTTAQRVAWELSRKRSIPKGRSVTQTCGLKRCVRPEHVQLIPVDGKPRPRAKAKPKLKVTYKGTSKKAVAKTVAKYKAIKKRPKVRRPRPPSKGHIQRGPRRPKPPVAPPPTAPAPPPPSEPLGDLA